MIAASLILSVWLSAAPVADFVQQTRQWLPKLYLFRKNQYDRKGKRHGHREFFYDAANTRLAEAFLG
ncbi:MAG: hypothetical protein LPK19_14570 [Hymenobacteraceae bacterium]|nr:hypothetical protein [Hymenobacteraceae bacterium]MDX5397455.1 hypothetical protein [Hymenobacteraceae bacterium]MDX5513533.1 hypothetical protein [Hymenobacteraceae bacterium]